MDSHDTIDPYASMRRDHDMAKHPGHELSGVISDRLRSKFGEDSPMWGDGSQRIDTGADVTNPYDRKRKVQPMTKKTERIGRESGKSSSRWLSPQKPQTGDGKTSRSIFDKVKVVFKGARKS
jgi:hypothetical protein